MSLPSSTHNHRTAAISLGLFAMVCVACGSATTVTVGDGGDAVEPAGVDVSVSAGVSVARDDADLPDLESLEVVDGMVTLPDGWFEMAGYGTVLHVDGDDVVPYYVTTSTCTMGDTEDNEFPVDSAEAVDGILVVDLVGTTTVNRLLPLSSGVECDSDPDDALVALDELFATHYPFFDERGLDWNDQMDRIRTVAAAGDEALAAEVEAFVQRLGDGHTTFGGDVDVDPADFGVDGVTTIEQVNQLYADEAAATFAAIDDLDFDPAVSVGWGTLAEDVGYLVVTDFLADDHEAFDAALSGAVAALDERFDRLVVDMRFNPGGYGDLAVLTAGHFTDEPTPAYRKWAYAEPDPFVQTIEIEPAGEHFDGRIAVLTSPVTASAAEEFLLAIRAVADPILVGAPSFGAFSDAIDWVLPDGTELTLSMEVYTDLDGVSYEGTGIPVDVAAPFDETVEAALADLTSTP